VLLHSADVAARIAHIGAYFLYETALPPKLRALTWLITARDLDCNYAWRAGIHAALAAGVGDALITAIEIDQRPSALGANEKALFDFCHQLLRGNHHVDDATYQAAVDQFGVPLTVQIAATVGYIMMMSVIVNAFDIAPVDDDARPAL
jgi:4-carboxymuconolactone decarboxylase